MASVTDSTVAAAEEEDSIPSLDNVWGCPGIELFCIGKKKMMRCTTCPLDVSIAGNNVWVKSATKLLAHKCGISGQGIRKCKGISKRDRMMFRQLLSEKTHASEQRAQARSVVIQDKAVKGRKSSTILNMASEIAKRKRGNCI